MFNLHPVFSCKNFSILQFIQHTERFLDISKVSLGSLNPIIPVDESSWKYRLLEDKLEGFGEELYSLLPNRKYAINLSHTHNIVINFLTSLGTEKRDLRCNALNVLKAAVDLQGNMYSCLNFHKKYANITNPNTDHFIPTCIKTPKFTKKVEAKCKDCLVFALCIGGCIYIDSKYEDYVCSSDYHIHYAMFRYAMYLLTGGYELNKTEPQC
jgi:radical SAM protein with 4Fe4S-binding SPASM domain